MRPEQDRIVSLLGALAATAVFTLNGPVASFLVDLNAYSLALKNYVTRRGGTYLFSSTEVPFVPEARLGAGRRADEIQERHACRAGAPRQVAGGRSGDVPRAVRGGGGAADPTTTTSRSGRELGSECRACPAIIQAKPGYSLAVWLQSPSHRRQRPPLAPHTTSPAAAGW